MNLYAKKIYNSFVGVGSWATLCFNTTRSFFQKPPSWSLILDQFYHIGILSLPVVAITGFATGFILAAQGYYQLGDKGLTSAIGLIVAKSMLTEIGPALTAFMVTGRVGSAMCAVIGTMRVTEQIDALKSMAVNPLRYLIAPRILGSVVMLPLLTAFSAVLGIYGGYLISVYVFKLTPQSYFDPMPTNITYFDMWIGVIKASVFGLIISTICCYKGLTTKGGAAGVGRSITNSIVICYSMILIINLFMTIGLNVLHTQLVEKYQL